MPAKRHPLVILDGGLASELEARGESLADALWSARLLIENPDLIREVHLDYLRAGADWVTSASYQASVAGFARLGIGASEAEALLRLSVTLAVEARERFQSSAEAAGRGRPGVAASVGPYGAFLADGSEYRGDYGVGEVELEEFHRDRLQLLASAGADLLACETVPSALEARVLTRLLEDTPGAAGWISFTLRDGRTLSDGTPLAEVAAEVDRVPAVVAIGVNCVPPVRVAPALEVLREATAKPILVYPNAGETYDAESKTWQEGGGPSLLELAADWRAAGASWIGGCCRTGPEDIRGLRERLTSLEAR